MMSLQVDKDDYGEPRVEILTIASVRGGGVFYGGLLAALAVSVWYMRKTKLPGWKTADVFAPAIALGHGIGRIGCFMAGCCLGGEGDRPWAVTVTSPVAHELGGVPPNGRIHPTTLYEAF